MDLYIYDAMPIYRVVSHLVMLYICRFEDLVLSDGEGIPTPDFLSACRAVVPFFGESLYTNVSVYYVNMYIFRHTQFYCLCSSQG